MVYGIPGCNKVAAPEQPLDPRPGDRSRRTCSTAGGGGVQVTVWSGAIVTWPGVIDGHLAWIVPLSQVALVILDPGGRCLLNLQ